MRKLVVMVVLFLGGMTAQANQVTNLDHNNATGIRYNVPQAINFIQRGVKFTVFPNGEFDFKIQNSVNYGRRYTNAPGTTYSSNGNNSRYISYDYLGNVTKVGRNYIQYNRYCDVTQIGEISLQYTNGRLVRVGGLKIFYNRYGKISHTQGNVTNYSPNANYGTNNNTTIRNRNNVVVNSGRRS